MPLAVVEGSPAWKFFRSVICLSTSANWFCNFSSCLRMDATYWALPVLVATGFGLSFSFASPTTETPLVDLEMSSLVQTFLGFFASDEAAESCVAGAGLDVPGSVVCATAGNAVRRSASMGKESERSMEPPVPQKRGRTSQDSVGGKSQGSAVG